MILRKLRRIPDHLRPRRLHVYGIGTGKSGTTTLARMFGDYRAAHELDARHLVPIATAVISGELAPDTPRVRLALRRRAARFHLEVDAAGFLNPLAATLASLSPDARFVVTLRDCFSWVDSRIEWDLRYQDAQDPVFSPLAAAYYAKYPMDFAPEEAPLRDAGVQPLDTYLRSWAERNAGALRAAAPERVLVLRTEDLDGAADDLARFAGVPVGTVHAAHANSNSNRVGVLARLPRDFVVERARRHCAEIMETYWGPDWCNLQNRLPARPPAR